MDTKSMALFRPGSDLASFLHSESFLRGCPFDSIRGPSASSFIYVADPTT
jgi:hypothetical protein